MRVTLRRLMALILVIGAIVAWAVHGVRVQSDAAAAIRQAHGRVYYEWEPKDAALNRSGAPWAPRWVVDLSVSISSAEWRSAPWSGRVGKRDVSHRESRGLEQLDCGGSRLSDSDLARLSHLTKLRELVLDNTGITDRGLAHLDKLSSLETLTLRNTGITDGGLVHLRGLTNLKNLCLDGTPSEGCGVGPLEVVE